ncbi:hypothetical protein HYALB_00011333 [Hymenoscyphus albidus]|uniref:Uncharacterized protein n=1 Tax=Hymenoscyphus albidus TaxID=595503 RepID=A0A9N9LXB4_9HELO|nr:hypothetical protein HYALB_00011333 [Hymenoscyphus albidus]
MDLTAAPTFELVVQFTKRLSKKLEKNNQESAQAFQELADQLHSAASDCNIHRVSNVLVLRCPSETARDCYQKSFLSESFNVVGQSVKLYALAVKKAEEWWFPVKVQFHKAKNLTLPDDIPNLAKAYTALSSQLKTQPQIFHCHIISTKDLVIIRCPSHHLQRIYKRRYDGASVMISGVSFQLSAASDDKESIRAVLAYENAQFMKEVDAEIKLLLEGNFGDSEEEHSGGQPTQPKETSQTQNGNGESVITSKISEMTPNVPRIPSMRDLQHQNDEYKGILGKQQENIRHLTQTITSLQEQLTAADKAQTLLREKLEKAESANRKVAAPQNPKNDAMEESSIGNKRRRVATVEENSEVRGVISQLNRHRVETVEENAKARGIISDPNSWRPGQPARLPPGTPRNPPGYVRTYRKITQEECEIRIPAGHDMFRHESSYLFWMPAGIFGLDYEE